MSNKEQLNKSNDRDAFYADQLARVLEGIEARLRMNLASEILRFFISRTDCYAVQTSRGYVRVEEPLTREVIEALRGEKTVGAYQINHIDNTVKYLCFDLDPEHLEDPREVTGKIIKVCLEEKDGRPRIWKHSLLLERARWILDLKTSCACEKKKRPYGGD